MENVNKYLKGKNGILALSNVPGWGTVGHVDVFNSQFKCAGGDCHFGRGGDLSIWVIKEDPPPKIKAYTGQPLKGGYQRDRFRRIAGGIQ
jgi:hypothetical protein